MKLSNCVVLTGSIGCGKSSVCEILESKGFKVIDADKISKEISKVSAPIIASTFGSEYIQNGSIDTNRLGQLVFSDKNAKAKLEAILHPPIKEKIFAEAEKLEKDNKIYFIDIPLFFETQNYSELKPIAVVYAPLDAQIERVSSRNCLGREEAIKRIGSQIDIEKKVKMANFVIDNSGDKLDLKNRVNNFLEEVENWFCKNTAQAETTF